MKRQENSGHFLKLVSIVLLSLVAFLLIIAIFIKIDEYQKSTYKLDVKFSDNDVAKLTNKLPISDAIGMNYNGAGMEKGIAIYKEFTISNPNDRKINYEIYLTRISTKGNDIRSNYIKLYLVDENNDPVAGFDKTPLKTYYDLTSLKDKLSSRLLYSSSLKKGETKKFILKSWVADTYIISQNEETFGFDIDVRIK